MGLIKKFFFVYLALIFLAVSAYIVSRFFAPPRDPDTLFTIYIASVRSFDPVKVADVISGDIAGHFYEPLFNYRYGGKADETFPQLAADFPKVSEDGLTYTFPIRTGVHYWDPQEGSKQIWPETDGKGPEVTAHDFVYAWKRMANAQLAAPSFSTFLQGNVVGLDDFYDYSQNAPAGKVDYSRKVEGLQALDDHTLQVKLTKPIPNFVQYCAYMGLAVMNKDAVDRLEKSGQTLREHPIGTGPYGLKRYVVDQRVELAANPYYRGKPDVNGGTVVPEAERIPKIKKIQFDYFPETLSAWHLFLQGRYDVMAPPKETFAGAVDIRTKTVNPELAKQHITLKVRPDPGLFYLQFNMRDPVIGKSKALRQALSLAIDRERYIRVYRSGRGLVGTGILPPDVALFDQNYQSKWTKFDMALARDKVAEAKRELGGTIPPLTIQMSGTDTDDRQIAEFFMTAWRDIGIDCKADYNDYARYLEMIDTKQYQITYTGWIQDYPDEKTYLALFDARLVEPPGSNSSSFVNADYQATLEKAFGIPRSPERDKMYLHMRDILDEELPVAAVFYPMVYSLRYDWLEGYKEPKLTSGFYAYQTLDTKRRREILVGH